MLLASGVSITYTVTATNILPTAISSALSTASSSGVLAQALSDNGYSGVTASSPSVLQSSTSSSGFSASGSDAGSSSGGCFAVSETVSLESGETKLISEAVVGDHILSVNAVNKLVYSEVIAVPHAKNDIEARFTQLVTESGRDVKMTGLHMIAAGSCSAADGTGNLSLIYASAVKAGNCIKTVDGLEKVVEVKESVSKGIYTVVTMEEFVVVNSIVVSPFAISHVFVNVYYNVHRLLCAYLPTVFKNTSGMLQYMNEMVGKTVMRVIS